MGGGAAPPPNTPALLSREEMNKHVFSNTQEGESQTKTLQGVKSEEINTHEWNVFTDRQEGESQTYSLGSKKAWKQSKAKESLLCKTNKWVKASSPTHKMEKPHEIALGGKSEENKVIKGRFADRGGLRPRPAFFWTAHFAAFSLPLTPPLFWTSELQTLLLSLSSTTIRVVAKATTTTTKPVTQQQQQQQQQRRQRQ